MHQNNSELPLHLSARLPEFYRFFLHAALQRLGFGNSNLRRICAIGHVGKSNRLSRDAKLHARLFLQRSHDAEEVFGVGIAARGQYPMQALAWFVDFRRETFESDGRVIHRLSMQVCRRGSIRVVISLHEG